MSHGESILMSHTSTLQSKQELLEKKEEEIKKLQDQLTDFRNEADKTSKAKQELENKEFSLQTEITTLQV